jgi:hypothetical protein
VSPEASCADLRQALAKHANLRVDQLVLRTSHDCAPFSDELPVSVAALGTNFIAKVIPLNITVEVALVSQEMYAQRVAAAVAAEPQASQKAAAAAAAAEEGKKVSGLDARYSIEADRSPLLSPIWSHKAHVKHTFAHLLSWLTSRESGAPGLRGLYVHLLPNVLEVTRVYVSANGEVVRSALCKHKPFVSAAESAADLPQVMRLEVRVVPTGERRSCCPSFPIHVKQLTGKTTTLDVDSSDSIEAIKQARTLRCTALPLPSLRGSNLRLTAGALRIPLLCYSFSFL